MAESTAPARIGGVHHPAAKAEPRHTGVNPLPRGCPGDVRCQPPRLVVVLGITGIHGARGRTVSSHRRAARAARIVVASSPCCRQSLSSGLLSVVNIDLADPRTGILPRACLEPNMMPACYRPAALRA
jgi:hypothetical protein